MKSNKGASRDRKSEASFFNSLKIESNSAIESLPKLARKKVKAMVSAKKRQTGHYFESNIEDPMVPIQLGPYRLLYGYQRSNLNLQNMKDSQPYHCLRLTKKDSVFFNFTNCGQSAVSIAILAAQKMYDSNSIDSWTEVYYETYEFLKDFKISWRIDDRSLKRPGSAILFIDSSTLKNFSGTSQKYACVILDTTCWDLGSAKQRKIVDYFLKKGTDVVLARSHIKLDCLGTEWNRLGSVLFISRGSDRKSRVFRSEFSKRASPLGINAEIRQIYPFLHDARFRTLSKIWVEQIRTANKTLARSLEKTLAREMKNSEVIRIETFDHHLFFWIVVKESNIEINRDRVQILIDDLKTIDVPALDLASYPWDFFSFTVFSKRFQGRSSRSNNKSNVGVIRVSACHTDSNKADQVLRIVNGWMKTVLE